MISPDRVKIEAEKKEDENIRFRTYLKTYADSRKLDRQFSKLHEELFEGYDCSSCRNCCKAYHSEIEEYEITEASEYLHMNEEEFKEKFLKMNNDGTYISKNMPCDFLQDDGECMLGECRPLTCRNYPYTNQPDRLFSLFGMLDSITVCPVAYEIWERLKDIYGFKRKK